MPYLKDDETMESRVEDLLDRVRRSPQQSERERYAMELGALASAHALTFRMPELATVNVLRGDGNGLEPDNMDQDTIDYLVGVLDATYGGEAPAAVKASYLFHLTGQGQPVELTGPEFALEPQGNDPEDAIDWADLADDGTDLTAREREYASRLPIPDGMEDGLPDDDPQPMSAADRLRARTKKSTKGKK